MKALNLCAAIAVLASGLTGAHADAAKPTWRLDGLNTPESALLSPSGDVLYVSNINGAPTEKDGNGFISKVSPEGQLVTAKWATGLNAPKGMAVVGDTLFVADIDELTAIDLATGAIRKRYAAKGAKFLNDIAVDSDGRVYVSDMVGNIIWRLDGENFDRWLESDKLKSPNGLVVRGDMLIVGAWGVMTNGFATDVPGHLLKVSLKDKSIANLGSGASVGNLDGLEILSETEFLATDWLAGKVLKIHESGSATTLFDLTQGSADLEFSAPRNTIYVPLMKNDALVAYPLPAQ